jgi:hypothetical protein
VTFDVARLRNFAAGWTACGTYYRARNFPNEMSKLQTQGFALGFAGGKTAVSGPAILTGYADSPWHG